jgi:hypothetical protein
MSSINQQKYDRLKAKAEKLFTEKGKIKSLALGSVKLNSEGFLHLIFKDRKHKRDWKNQVKRFELLDYLIPVLEGMQYYQEYCERMQTVKVKRQNTVLLEAKIVKYWGFVAVIKDKIRIKIILKQTGGGEIMFWSIIPYWKTQNYKDIACINLATGDIEND